MLILFCFVVKLDSPKEIPAKEIAFYAYMLVRSQFVSLCSHVLLYVCISFFSVL